MMAIVMSVVYGTRATEVIATHQSRHLAYNEWILSESDTHGKLNCVIKIHFNVIKTNVT